MRTNLNTPEWETARAVVSVVTAPVRPFVKCYCRITVRNNTDRHLNFLGASAVHEEEDESEVAACSSSGGLDVDSTAVGVEDAAVGSDGGQCDSADTAVEAEGVLHRWRRKKQARKEAKKVQREVKKQAKKAVKGSWFFDAGVAPNNEHTCGLHATHWSGAGRFTLVGVGDICLAGACPRIGSLKVNGEWSEDVKRTWKNTRGDAPVQASKGRFLLEGACKQSGPWRLWNFTIKEIAPAVNQTVSREAQVEVGDTTSDVE